MTTRRMLAALWCVLLCVAEGTADTDGAVVLTGNALDHSRVEEADGQAAVQHKSELAEITLDIHGAYKKVVLALLEAADEGTTVTGIAALDSLAATYGNSCRRECIRSTRPIHLSVRRQRENERRGAFICQLQDKYKDQVAVLVDW